MLLPQNLQQYLPNRIPGWVFFAVVKSFKFLLLPVVGGGGWLARRWALSRSSHWPATQGRVEGFFPGEASGCMALVTYSYSVLGEYYSGEMPVQKSLQFSDVDDLRRKLPVGAAIEVRFREHAPQVSVGVIPKLAFEVDPWNPL